MSEHSLLSPSSSSRWLNCSASVLLPQFDDSDHKAADEGTLAHKLAEYKLSQDEWYDYGEEIINLKKNELYSDEMEEHINRYVDYVESRPYTRRLIEEVVDLGFIYPNFFGTADCILVDQDRATLEVIDLKYGRYRVSPEENTQLMIYAIGAAKIFRKELKDFDDFSVRLTIYQPRIDNVKTWETSWKHIAQWNSQFLIPAISKIAYEKVEENTGHWCRYCNARVFCNEYNTELMMDDENSQIKILSNEDIEKNYSRLKEIEAYLKHLKEYITTQIKDGKEFTQYKLVAGNKRKYWKNSDHTGLKEKLKKNDDLDKVLDLVSPSEFVKRLGEDANRYEDYIELKEDKPLLVKKTDKRKELVFEN